MPGLSVLSRSFTKTIRQHKAKKETHEESAMYFYPYLIHCLTYLGEDVIIKLVNNQFDYMSKIP